MKTWKFIILAPLVFIGVIYWGDGAIIQWILGLFPPSAHDWLPILKIILWICAFLWTLPIAALITFIILGIVGLLIPKKKTSFDKRFGNSRNPMFGSNARFLK